jgi:hypothetical protein
MKIWLVWIMAEDGYTWLEAAMDDDSTAESGGAWEKEVNRCKSIVSENKGYLMRIQAVNVPGVIEMFDIPEVTATEA